MPPGPADSAKPAPPQDAKLPEVSVRGEASGSRLSRSAEAVSVIDMKRAHAHRASADMGEVLARSPGIIVRREGGLGSTARVSLNGFQDEQVRFFVDGVPLAYTGMTFGVANVPIDFVERVEVYRGVVPIRFGADALGGAINLVTEPKRGTRTSASYQVGSFGTYRATVAGHYFDPQTGFFARANAFYDRAKNDYSVDVDVPGAGSRTERATVHRFHDAYRAYGAGLEAGVLDRGWARRLSLRVYGTAFDKDIQNNLIMANPYGEVRAGVDSLGATARYQSPFVPVGSTKLSVSTITGYDHRSIAFVDRAEWNYDWFGRRTVPTGSRQGETGGFKTDQVLREHAVFERLGLDWVVSPDLVLRAQMAPTWVSRAGEQKLPLEPGKADPLSGGRKLLTWTNGLEADVHLFDRRLQNIAFVKHYYMSSQADELVTDTQFRSTDRTDSSFGGGDALRFRFLPWLYGKASYEHATRLPSPTELFGDGTLVEGNIALVPETSDNVNVGFLIETGPTRAGALTAEVNGFLRYADHLITTIINNTSYDYQNVYSARSAGGEGLVGYRSPGDYFSLDGSLTLQDFRNTSNEGAFFKMEGDRIPNLPWLFGSLSARARVPDVVTRRDEVSLAWTTRYLHDFYRSWEGQGEKASKDHLASQLLHSVALTYLLRSPATLSATLEAQNLTDARAYDNFGVQRPGRAFFFKGTFERDWDAW
ncbi:TonB-dependent siderophore myxochelin receptor MxcH [Pendulispora albinea]|uniref:TonB-dependent siderophore myxochelin receptor MxcH n=1 Tax=Pendulispora albinea TaxID=2741071 RepID=A0ABZ2M569_9BACT